MEFEVPRLLSVLTRQFPRCQSFLLSLPSFPILSSFSAIFPSLFLSFLFFSLLNSDVPLNFSPFGKIPGFSDVSALP